MGQTRFVFHKNKLIGFECLLLNPRNVETVHIFISRIIKVVQVMSSIYQYYVLARILKRRNRHNIVPLACFVKMTAILNINQFSWAGIS